MKVKIEYEIKNADELIADLLVTAIEGGSNYWCKEILRTAGPKPDKEDPWYSQKKLFAEDSGIVIQVAEIDPSSAAVKDGIWFVNIDMMKNAFQLMAEFGTPKGWHLQNLIKEEWDAETADVWLQLATFGKVIYG